MKSTSIKSTPGAQAKQAPGWRGKMGFGVALALAGTVGLGVDIYNNAMFGLMFGPGFALVFGLAGLFLGLFSAALGYIGFNWRSGFAWFCAAMIVLSGAMTVIAGKTRYGSAMGGQIVSSARSASAETGARAGLDAAGKRRDEAEAREKAASEKAAAIVIAELPADVERELGAAKASVEALARAAHARGVEAPSAKGKSKRAEPDEAGIAAICQQDRKCREREAGIAAIAARLRAANAASSAKSEAVAQAEAARTEVQSAREGVQSAVERLREVERLRGQSALTDAAALAGGDEVAAAKDMALWVEWLALALTLAAGLAWEPAVWLIREALAMRSAQRAGGAAKARKAGVDASAHRDGDGPKPGVRVAADRGEASGTLPAGVVRMTPRTPAQKSPARNGQPARRGRPRNMAQWWAVANALAEAGPEMSLRAILGLPEIARLGVTWGTLQRWNATDEMQEAVAQIRDAGAARMAAAQ